MNLSQIKTCQNCNLLRILLDDIDESIFKRVKVKWNNRKYNMNIPFDADVYKDLLRYKRIIDSRIHNPSYPNECVTNQDIIGRVEVLLNK